MSGPSRANVAILAGGFGTRLAARTGGRPKPMAPILGRPALEHQMTLCRRHGFDRILLLVHYGHDTIQRHFEDGSRFGVRITYAVEPAPRGTAGALADALSHLDETFVVLYGDTFLDVDLRRMWTTHQKSGAEATVFVHPNHHPGDSDLVDIDDEGLVTAIHPYPHAAGMEYDNLAVAALFVLQHSAVARAAARPEPTDLTRHLLPSLLAGHGRVAAYVSPEYIKDFGTPERLDRVADDIARGVPERLSGRRLRPAVFLDRDGTINREVSYVTRPDQLELIDGAGAALARLNAAGVLSIVITNQAAIARGAMTAPDLQRIHRRLQHLLGRAGAYVDRIHACPHHPDRGFAGEVVELKIECECRKPGTRLIDDACRELLIDRRVSWCVGDTTSDIEAGRRASLRTILLRTGHAGRDGRLPVQPDYVTVDLAAAVDWILEGHGVISRRIAPVAAAAVDARLVLIGGLARSGKSFAAQVLKEATAACGRTAHVLSTDSWLKPVAERTEGTGVASRFDTAALADTLRPLLAASDRRNLEVPIYDRACRSMFEQPASLSIGPDDLLIVEGVAALLARDLRPLPAVRVHVELPEDLRRAHLRADYRWRGETDARIDALIASRHADESGAVQAARASASFIIPSWVPA